MSGQRLFKIGDNGMSDETAGNSDEIVFENSTTLKVYLYLRSVKAQAIGIRETQRELGFNSPGTVQWHLEKLREADIVKKLPSNKYELTEKGKTISEVNLPLEFPFKFLKGQLIPRSNFHLSFSISSLVILLFFILTGFPTRMSLFLALFFMIVHTILYLKARLTIQRRLTKFISDED